MMSYAVHRNETFFWENFIEYSSNVTLLCTNYRNKYISTVSSKKIIGNMFFYIELTSTPPPP